MRTRNVDRSLHTNYLQKAMESLETARDSYKKGFYNASVVNSVHAIISAADSLIVYVKGLRYAGTRHEEAVELFSTLFPNDPNLRKNVQRFGAIISIKTKAEYIEKLQKRSDAELALKDAERFLNYVKSKLPEG